MYVCVIYYIKHLEIANCCRRLITIKGQFKALKTHEAGSDALVTELSLHQMPTQIFWVISPLASPFSFLWDSPHVILNLSNFPLVIFNYSITPKK